MTESKELKLLHALQFAANAHRTQKRKVEDQPVTYEELAERFGKPVADVVLEVTDDKTLERAVRKQKQVEHAPHKSDLAKQLKIADKISNIRDVAGTPGIGWDQQRRAEYLDWAQQVVDGLRGVNAQLDALFDATLAECRTMLAGES
jgi:GTP diphosphokinase / guanosine-3',5'-bis(diphosphate) 3'-diphosphatase